MKGKKPRRFNPAFFKQSQGTNDAMADDIVIAAPQKNPNIDYQAMAQANAAIAS